MGRWPSSTPEFLIQQMLANRGYYSRFNVARDGRKAHKHGGEWERTVFPNNARLERAMNTMKSILLSLVIWLTIPAIAYAQPDLDDTFSLTLGLFIADRNTDTRLDSDTLGTGTDIDLEDDLGLRGSDSIFRIDGQYRFHAKHRINFSYFDLSRDSVIPISRDIQFGDQLFVLNTAINSNFGLKISKLAYTYSLLRRDKGYLGLSAGLYVADSTISMAAADQPQNEIGELTAPLPVFGVRGDYSMTDRWTFRASGEFFALEYNNIDGSIVDLYAGVDYQAFEHVAFGLAYNAVTIDVDVAKETYSGAIDWAYAGAMLYMKVDW